MQGINGILQSFDLHCNSREDFDKQVIDICHFREANGMTAERDNEDHLTAERDNEDYLREANDMTAEGDNHNNIWSSFLHFFHRFFSLLPCFR
jgi:hypothetical protein